MGETSPPTGVTLKFTYTPEEYAQATRLFLNRTLPLKRNMILRKLLKQKRLAEAG